MIYAPLAGEFRKRTRARCVTVCGGSALQSYVVRSVKEVLWVDWCVDAVVVVVVVTENVSRRQEVYSPEGGFAVRPPAINFLENNR